MIEIKIKTPYKMKTTYYEDFTIAEKFSIRSVETLFFKEYNYLKTTKEYQKFAEFIFVLKIKSQEDINVVNKRYYNSEYGRYFNMATESYYHIFQENKEALKYCIMFLEEK